MWVVLLMTSCADAVKEDFSCAQGEVTIRLRQDETTTPTRTDGVLPEVGEFIVEVTETSTDRLFYRKKYADAEGQKVTLNAGEHRLFAYYGDPQGTGFNSFYYVADTLFNVTSSKVSDIEAVASLANVKVAVQFGPGLALDYNEYYAEVITSSGELTFTKKETRCGYAPVGDLSLILYIYVQDRWMCYKSAPVTCQSNDFVTFNVDTERFGDLADIRIVIDDGTDEVVKDCKVPAEAAPQDAPTLTVAGFTGNRFSTYEADCTGYEGFKADIVAMGGIGSCILEISSGYLSGLGVPARVDLALASAGDAAALEKVGIRYMRDMAGKRLSYVDFSGVVDYVARNAPYSSDNAASCADFTLSVTDRAGKSVRSETYTLAVDKSEAALSWNDYDIWATRLYAPVLKVTKGDPSKFVLRYTRTTDLTNQELKTIEPVSVKGNVAAFPDLTALYPGSTYRIWAQYNGNGYNTTTSQNFTTEAAQQVDNNSFESFTINTFSGTHSTNWYELWAPGTADTWWAVNSSITLDKSNSVGYSNFKSFPTVNVTSKDPQSGSYAVSVASIAVGDASSHWNLANAWGDACTGELFIGKADNSGEHKGGHTADGHAFASRPSGMTFWYKLDCHESDPYYVEIQVLDSEGQVIGSAKKTDGAASVSSWTKVTLPIEYDLMTRKAAQIYIIFKSSATGKTSSRRYQSLSRYESSGEKTLSGDGIHAGNILWIDNVQLYY